MHTILRPFVLFMLVLVLVGCGTTAEQAAAPPPPIAIVVPTAVPTAVALADIDLEPILIQNGDLPSGMTGAQVRDSAPPAFKEVPSAQKAIYQRFQRENATIGGVTVFLFDKQAERDKGYTIIKGKSYKSQEGIGEQLAVFSKTSTLPVNSVTFVRCHALVEVTMGGGSEVDETLAYAKRLDHRLVKTVC